MKKVCINYWVDGPEVIDLKTLLDQERFQLAAFQTLKIPSYLMESSHPIPEITAPLSGEIIDTNFKTYEVVGGLWIPNSTEQLFSKVTRVLKVIPETRLESVIDRFYQESKNGRKKQEPPPRLPFTLRPF